MLCYEADSAHIQDLKNKNIRQRELTKKRGKGIEQGQVFHFMAGCNNYKHILLFRVPYSKA